MRTTITFPDDVHRRLEALARDHRTSLSGEVNRIVAQALQPNESAPRYLGNDELTGFPLFGSQGPITTEDIRSLEDDA